MRGTLGIGALLVTGLCFGCGGETPPAAAPTPAMVAAPAPAPSVAQAQAQPPSTSASLPAGPVAEPPLDDPNERSGPIAMVIRFDKAKSKASFPRKAKSDAQCWAQVSATGDHAKDYQSIVDACGAPTGLVEYAKPVDGKLHHQHDPEDVFTLSVLAGYCYRYFAIADASITDLDLLIEKKGGALVGDDKTNGPYAIVDGEQAWCQDEDLNLEFHLKVDGPGKGGYTFGVWARPKSSGGTALR